MARPFFGVAPLSLEVYEVMMSPRYKKHRGFPYCIGVLSRHRGNDD